jgi:hypothetical protein
MNTSICVFVIFNNPQIEIPQIVDLMHLRAMKPCIEAVAPGEIARRFDVANRANEACR